MTDIIIRQADFSVDQDKTAFLDLLDYYSCDPFGAGQPLNSEVRESLVDAFSSHPGAYCLLAFCNDKPVGLVNCLTSFSTFKAKPRINIHDIVVHHDQRGSGVGVKLMDAVRASAIQRGACAVTLEVRADNERARRIYEKFGFEGIANPPTSETHFFGVLKIS